MSEEPTRRSYDVAVIGYGPVGAGAAVFLADAGLRVAVIERSTDVYDLPRAVNLDGEVLRAFQRIGLAEEISAVAQEPGEGEGAFFTNSKREVLFGLTFPKSGHNGWRDMNWIDQPEFEAAVRRLVQRSENIDVFGGHEVTSLSQTDEVVTVKADNLSGGDALKIEASYVIGCDGASSFVRRMLGFEWESLGYDQDWLVIDIVEKRPDIFPTITMQVCDPARITTFVRGKTPNRRWEFQLLPGETREEMTTPEKITELVAPWCDADDYALRRAVVYQFHAANASSWRDRRIFLAGDAAHQTPPFLGQGLNSGFRDVVNLGWKIPLVLRGEAATSLLDSYEAERDGHARDLVEWAVAVGQLMEGLAAAEASAAKNPPTEADPSPASEIDTSAGYGQSRMVPPLRTGLLMDEQVSDEGSTGYIFRQPRIAREGGSESVGMDEVLGRDFALITRTSADAKMSAESAGYLERIGARVLHLEELDLRDGSFDSVFDNHTAVIVRPDRYIFGHTDETTDVDALVARLETKLNPRA